jgi:hypothetical protein
MQYGIMFLMPISLKDIREYLDQYQIGDINGGERWDELELPPRMRGQLQAQPSESHRTQLNDEGQGPRRIPIDRYDPRARLLGTGEFSEDWSPSDPIPTPEPSRRESIIENYDATVRERGFEALAFYMPFHFDPSRYGIYIREEGLYALTARIYCAFHELDAINGSGSMALDFDEIEPSHEPWSSKPDQIALLIAFDLATEILLRHEWFHHQVELLTAYLEDARDERSYVHYHEDIYKETFADSECIEESLANASVARSRRCANILGSTQLFDEVFKRLTQSQPPAYRSYEQFEGTEFGKGCEHLARLTIDVDSRVEDGTAKVPPRTRLGTELPFSTDINSAQGSGRMPVYIIVSQSDQPGSKGPEFFDVVQISTDYRIETTETWEQSYRQADGSLKQLVDRNIEDIKRNINLPGFNWQHCGQERQYGRLNDQFRFIVRRHDRQRRIELIDFGGHELPREYGCY